jgi:hypothetical protein
LNQQSIDLPLSSTVPQAVQERSSRGVRVGKYFAGLILPALRDTRPRQLQIVETLALGPNKSLLLISCAGNRYLAGVGSQGVNTILLIDQEEAVPLADDCQGLIPCSE